ncbi:MAG: Smr/MutS family protein [Salibacteraceae bacterium]
MKIGDTVSVINEPVKGVVTQILGDSIEVTVDGMEFFYSKAAVIVIDTPEHILTKQYIDNSPISKTVKGDDLPKIVELTEKEKIEELGRVRGKRNSKGILEFDLHIHDLLAKHSHMTPTEMLNYQLDYAVHCLEETIRKRERSLILIHGVGKGVLKTELHKIIRAYQLSYHDGFMQEYGMGATKIELI